jgi:hypothetical protein
MYRLQVICPDIYILGQTTNSTGSRSNTWILHVAGSDPRSSTACRSSPKKSKRLRVRARRSDSEIYRLQVRSQEVHRLQVRLRALQTVGQIPGGP